MSKAAGSWRGAERGAADLESIRRLGPAALEVARRLVEHFLAGSGRTLRWSSLVRFAPEGMDRLDVEEFAATLRDAGLLQIKVRSDHRGDPEPYLLRLTPQQEPRAIEAVGLQLQEPPGVAHDDRARRIVAALGRLMEEDGALPVPGRALIQQALGDTKRARVADYRGEIESAFGVPLEQLVQDHTAAVLTAGRIRYRFRGIQVNARASHPWLAITEPVLQGLTDLEVDAVEVITVENLTPFEVLASKQGLHDDAVLVYTAGFLGRAQRAWCRILARHPAVERFRHWSDLDPGGLYIFRDLERLLEEVAPGLELSPWRMAPEFLEHPLAVPLTPRDHARLKAYLDETQNPLRALARAMLAEDRKLEQEALLLGPVEA